MFLYIFCYFSQSQAGRNILSDKVSGFFSLRTASIARAGRRWEGLDARTFHVQLYSFTGSETYFHSGPSNRGGVWRQEINIRS